MRSLIRLQLALPVLLMASGCTPSGMEPPSPPPTTLELFTGPPCYSTRDCGVGAALECSDPRYPRCGTIPVCAQVGLIQCGCGCRAEPCTAASCGADEECFPGGCCGPKACVVDWECGGTGARCVEGRCAQRGSCMPPAE